MRDEIKEKALEPFRRHVNAWKRTTGARVVSGCQVALLPSNRPPIVDGTTDRVAMRAVAHLHARWVVDIWPRGIAMVDDVFIVDLVEARSLDDLAVLACRWDPSPNGTWHAVVAPAWIWREPGTEGPWQLTWEDA